MLAAEPGRTFTRDQIIDGVFGYDFDGFDRTVDVHVANLRRKIEPDGKKHSLRPDRPRRRLPVRQCLNFASASGFASFWASLRCWPCP